MADAWHALSVDLGLAPPSSSERLRYGSRAGSLADRALKAIGEGSSSGGACGGAATG
jgi:hypothetical protein